MPISSEGYVLTEYALGRKNQIYISKIDYEEIVDARITLGKIGLFEEKFVNLTANYCDIQRMTFDSALNNMVFGLTSTTPIYSVGAEFGRLVSSFLSSTRLYLDAASSLIPAIAKDENCLSTVKELKSKEYDEIYCYRVMESIRNYSQHVSSPVHTASYNSKLRVDGIFEYISEFYFSIGAIEDKSKLKSAILAEIEQNGGKFDLKEGVRSYFGSICRIHEGNRDIIKARSDSCVATMERWKERWTSTYGRDHITAVAACRIEGGKLDNQSFTAHIAPQFDEYRNYLERRIPNLKNMERKCAVS